MGDVEVEGTLVQVGDRSRAELVGSLRDAGVQLNPFAETLLAHPLFAAPVRRSIRVVERTVEQLGLARGGVLSEVMAAVEHHGLGLCPLVTGPYLRLAMVNQANAPDSVLSAGRSPAGALHVASEPVTDDVEYPKGFYLRVVDGRPWLRGYRCDDTYLWTPEQRLACVLPDES